MPPERAAIARTTDTGVTLVLVSGHEIPISLLLCMDRSIGHDWNHNLRWDDGEDQKRGRWTYFQYLRIGRCTQCGSERTEIFETDAHNTRMDKVKNRYHYSDAFKHRPKLDVAEVRQAMRQYHITASA